MIVGTGFELNGSGNRKENVICTNSIDKREIWRVETGGVERRLFINDGKLFFFDEGGALNCLSVHDGTKIWQTDSLSKLNVYTTIPHMTFEGPQIIVYGSDLNNMVVLDSATGRTVDQGSYIEMRSKNRMPTWSSSYRIKKSDKVFVVSVSDSLESAEDYRQTFNVKIEEGTYR